MKDGISLGNDAEAGKALVTLMKDSEEEYQNGISENYQVKSYAKNLHPLNNAVFIQETSKLLILVFVYVSFIVSLLLSVVLLVCL